MAYVFLKSADSHEHRQNPVWWAVSADRIETMPVSSSYDRYGQKISASDAGDYLELLNQDAVDAANNAASVEFEAGDYVSAYEHAAAFNAVVNSCVRGIDYSLEETTFEGFTYWDGHNWQTVVVSSFDDNNTHEIEDDPETVARLNAALENAEFFAEGCGQKFCRFKDAEVTYSNLADRFEYAEITLDHEFEEVEH